MDKAILRRTALKITEIRSKVIEENTFFGRLLMRLPIIFSDCETAYTDMEKIVFGMEFSSRLSDKELEFVLLHELMHCVLKHCTRGRGKIGILYNIACDIVVNSVLLQKMGESEFSVDGCAVMHTAPDGREGNEYTAEEIYHMLEKKADRLFGTKGLLKTLDSHDCWDDITDTEVLEDRWDSSIRKAYSSENGSGIPSSLKRQVKIAFDRQKIPWRQILNDLIKNDRSDFEFLPPDRRFQGEFIMPSFNENVYGEKVEKLWFLIDTSGSISDTTLKEALSEIVSAMNQVDSLCGYLSFFDTEVTEPEEFSCIEDIEKITPTGGGGTSFFVIFRKLTEFFKEEMPSAIFILTDGYARFPDEEWAKGIPVYWIIIDSREKPPFGTAIYIESDE